jgi:hypothetical protein
MFRKGIEKMEREKGFEPSTSTLARLHSTPELLPQYPIKIDFKKRAAYKKLKMEAGVGFEPTSEGFADLSVSLFATRPTENGAGEGI